MFEQCTGAKGVLDGVREGWTKTQIWMILWTICMRTICMILCQDRRQNGVDIIIFHFFQWFLSNLSLGLDAVIDDKYFATKGFVRDADGIVYKIKGTIFCKIDDNFKNICLQPSKSHKFRHFFKISPRFCIDFADFEISWVLLFMFATCLLFC